MILAAGIIALIASGKPRASGDDPRADHFLAAGVV